MKAVKKFKKAIDHKRPAIMDTILGKDTRMVQPPLSMSRPETPSPYRRPRSVDAHDRRPIEQALVTEGVHRDIDTDNHNRSIPERTDTSMAFSAAAPSRSSTQASEQQAPLHDSPRRDLRANPEEHTANAHRDHPMHAATAPIPGEFKGKGQAHDPLSEHLYLALGPGACSRPPSPPAVSESPPAAETNIYEQAYDMEIRRLRSQPERNTTLFLTRRVEDKEEYRKDKDLVAGVRDDGSSTKSGIARVLDQARLKAARGEPLIQASQDDHDHEKSEASEA